MSAINQPAWLRDLLREAGPVLLGELVKLGTDAVLGGKRPDLLQGARRVRDVLPDPLPNVALDDEIDRDIADAKAKGGG
jgi:hypothetical protein